jgi:hypothetical protein
VARKQPQRDKNQQNGGAGWGSVAVEVGKAAAPDLGNTLGKQIAAHVKRAKNQKPAQKPAQNNGGSGWGSVASEVGKAAAPDIGSTLGKQIAMHVKRGVCSLISYVCLWTRLIDDI